MSANEVEDRKLLRLSRQEMERRWALVRTYLSERRIDALVTQTTRDFHGGYTKWLTDIPSANPRTVIFHASDWMSVIDHGPMGRRRTMDGYDRDHPGVGELLTTAAVPSVHFTQTTDAEVCVHVLRSRGYKRVALVGQANAPYGFVQHLVATLEGKVEFVDATDAVDHMKAIKSEEEICILRATAALQDEVFQSVLQHAKPGMRDVEVTALARHTAERAGSEQSLFLASSAPMGRPALFATRHFQGRVIQPGDQLLLLVENNGLGGYYTELVRTLVFGKASQELRDHFEVAKEAQQEALRRLVPGALCSEVGIANDEFMIDRGHHPEPRLFGHGQGYDIVERPILRFDETMRVEQNMNFAVHPAFATSSVYVTVCDNFIIGPNGVSERLHKTPQILFEV